MKRIAGKLEGMAAPIVRLNIGGIAFDVSRQTLEQIEYFDAYLHGRMNFATDADGRIFIDRNGETFAVLLDCIRMRFHFVQFGVLGSFDEFSRAS